MPCHTNEGLSAVLTQKLSHRRRWGGNSRRSESDGNASRSDSDTHPLGEDTPSDDDHQTTMLTAGGRTDGCWVQRRRTAGGRTAVGYSGEDMLKTGGSDDREDGGSDDREIPKTFLHAQKTSPEWMLPKKNAEAYEGLMRTNLQKFFLLGYDLGREAV
jgi:hypothetical protein